MMVVYVRTDPGCYYCCCCICCYYRRFTAIVVVGNLLTLCFYFVRRVDWVFFYLSGEDSKEHKKYSEFDTKHYTREAKFRVFWHKQYSKKYNEFPRVKRVLVKGK